MFKTVFTSSYDKKMDMLEERLAEEIGNKLDNLAADATTVSGRSTYPLDTGAYVNSFSMTKNSEGAKRSVSSEGLSTGSLSQSQGYEKLKSDIANIATVQNLRNIRQINLINAAPHALDVERGENWRSPGYMVFATLQDIGIR